MSKIVMFSDVYLPTFPYLELPLYYELKSKRLDVVYVLQNGDVRLTTPELSKHFCSLNLKTINHPGDIKRIVEHNDLLLMRFAYKGFGGDVGAKVRSMANRKILMYDPSGIDIRVRACPAQYLTAKSEALRLLTLKKFPRQYKHIFVTGTIHCDAVATTDADRDMFMRSYGLDPKKKFFILTPANPAEGGHQKGVDNEYANIVKVVQSQCPNAEIMVKAHPMDYTARMKAQPGIIHKNQHYGNQHSWESFAPGIKVVKAEEGYKALKACDAVLNVRSSIAMETALFKKPLININRSKYTTNWPFDPKIMIDVSLTELADVINAGKYSVDDKSCKEYCKRENMSDDGMAFVRTANAAVSILNGEI
jgi:hypothetical protein